MSRYSTTIAHATDLRADGRVAFEHALALAQKFGGRVVSLYALPPSGEAAGHPPDAAAAIAGWADDRPVPHEFIVRDDNDDAVVNLLVALNELEPDLLVVARRPANAFERMQQSSVSLGVALNTHVPTLLLNTEGRRFVAADDGEITLHTVVVPVGSVEAGQAALGVVSILAAAVARAQVDVHLVACGTSSVLDQLSLPAGGHLRFLPHALVDTVAHAVHVVAEEFDADLIVMASRGRSSVHNVFVGTNTEQVVRKSARPVLCVPLP